MHGGLGYSWTPSQPTPDPPSLDCSWACSAPSGGVTLLEYEQTTQKQHYGRVTTLQMHEKQQRTSQKTFVSLVSHLDVKLKVNSPTLTNEGPAVF